MFSGSTQRYSSPIRLAYGPDNSQFGDLYLPASSSMSGRSIPVVILIHGGYWRASYGLNLMVGLAQDLAARGIAGWNIEYRRIGNNGGGWPGTFVDVARATDHLTVLAAMYKLDLGRVVPIGHSAGGHLACWLGSRERLPKSSPLATRHTGPAMPPLKLHAVVSLAGVLDLQMAYEQHLSNDAVVELLGASPSEAPERYRITNPAKLLPLGIPQILIHGTPDVNVPVEISRAYANEARAAGDQVTFIEMPNIDHFAVIDATSEAWRRVMEEVGKVLV